MKGFEAQDLESLFKKAGRIRRNKREFSNDSTYWEGGHCNWGGSHNLREDCETIASSFAKIENLKDIKKVLKECTSETEFNSKKRDLLDTINQSTSGLRPRTGYASSMFGICIIWADEAMSPHVERCIEGCRKEVEKIKNALERESYKWVEELRQIELEIEQIKQKMEENKQKAMDPNISPSEKATLLEEIEADGKLLQQKYREHQEHSNKFRFDPSKVVSNLVEAMKKAIENSDRSRNRNSSGGGSPGGNRRNPTNPNDPFGEENWPNPNDGNIPSQTPRSRSFNQAEPRNNQQLILIALAVGAVIFFMLQKEKPVLRNSEYDYY